MAPQEHPRASQEHAGTGWGRGHFTRLLQIQLEPLVSARNAQNGQSQEMHKTDKTKKSTKRTKLRSAHSTNIKQETHNTHKTKRTKPRNAQNGQNQEKHKTDKAKKKGSQGKRLHKTKTPNIQSTKTQDQILAVRIVPSPTILKANFWRVGGSWPQAITIFIQI